MKKYMSLCLLFSLVSCGTTTDNSPRLINHIVAGNYIENEFVFPMNTITTLRMYYDNEYQEVNQRFDSIISSLSNEVDRYHYYDGINNLKTINDSCGSNQFIKVSNELFELIKLSVEFTKLTDGKFNLTMGTLIDLYDELLIEDDSGRFKEMLAQNIIDDAVLNIPTVDVIDDIIELNEKDKSIKLNKYNDSNVIISLGAIAKGFVMQKAYEYLKSYNYSCLFDAGSSTMGMIGSNPMKESGMWTIAFNNPSFNTEQYSPYISTISLKEDHFISTSADNSKNFFYKDSDGNTKMMHHIINPNTGISNNYLRTVSIISSNLSLTILDAMTTALFNCSTDDEAIELIGKIEENYKCDLSYILVKPYMESYSEYNVTLSSSYNDMLASSLPSEIKNIKIIDN